MFLPSAGTRALTAPRTQHSMRGRLCALLALVGADSPKIACHSGQDNDVEFATCSDYCTESRHCTKCKCRCFSAAFYCKTRVPAIVPLPRNSAVFATAPHGSTTCLTGPAMCALRRQQHRCRHRQKRMPWAVSSHTQFFRTLGRVFERRSSLSHGVWAHKSCWIMGPRPS